MQDMTIPEYSRHTVFEPSTVLASDVSTSSLDNWEIKTAKPDDWDQVVAQFDDVSFEQTAAFAAERWGAHRLVCVTIERAGKTVGGACVIIFRLPGLRRGVAYVKHGPAWRSRGGKVFYENYRSVITMLRRKFCYEQGHALVIVPRPFPQILPREFEILREMGFESGRQSRDPNRYLVDLSLSTEDQFKSLGQKWRYNLKRALSNNLEIKWSDDDEAISNFIELHSEMVSRKNFNNTDPMGALRSMQASLPLSHKPQTVLAYHSGRAIAGAVVMTCGDVSYYIFGASRDEALSLRAGYAIQWSIIEKLKQQGAKWYDLGGEAGAGGLRQFKNGLAGKRGVILDTQSEVQYCRGLRSRIARMLVIGASEVVRILRTPRTSDRNAK
ncbi:MAG: GNAT family N-acetyltransferase [Alphaproteobacteria bacterium]|nr:GNAT family N-acetyltransferase [Alphaproteobacteria bacterium]